jgi:F-type H+-transporting ATPase subunit alpha
MMQLLIQPQYAPMPLSEQVAVIYAGIHGYVDEVEVADVSAFGRELIQFVREHYPGALHQITDTGELSEEVEGQLKDALEHCCERFRSGRQSEEPAERGGEGEPA